MEKGITYLNRDFNDYKNSLLNYTKQYYPELDGEFNDASVGAWLIDLVANIGDNLSYHIDRVYQETNIESAQEKSSVYAIARNNGIKIPGPKASMAEVEFTCTIPVNGNNGNNTSSTPDWSYAPCIKKGTKMTAGSDVFELLYDVDFNEQFNEDGISNRIILPKRDSNGVINSYLIKKTGIISAGETKIFTKVFTNDDVTPFYSVILPDTNIMNIESIIFKPGTKHYSTPTLTEFYQDKEYINGKDDCNFDLQLYRFFEVDYLSQQYRWGDYNNNRTVTYESPTTFNINTNETTEQTYVKKGQWIPLRQKFITEFTDKGYMKIIFGGGTHYYDNPCSSDYIHLISHLINNDGLGSLPIPNSTMYVLYRKGGGASTNKAEGAINTITYLNLISRGEDSIKKNNVKRSITGINITPSVSGRDMPSIDEIKYLIKYNNGAQNRCVTVKDYHDRISKMPPRYGCPFRYSVSEENNKVMVYALGLDQNGNLSNILPSILCKNLVNYLSEYKMINDYVEIKSGRIINLQFEIDLYVDKNYNTSDVITNVINCVKSYMDINKLQMGDDIFVGDIEKEVSKIDGVLNLIELRVYNIYGNGYSETRTTQQIKTINECISNEEIDVYGIEENRSCIDLKASDKMLYTENDTMFEILKPESDIICRVKTR